MTLTLTCSRHQALCSLLRRDASINFKAKGNSLVSVLACNLLMAAYEEDENWPEIFVKVRNSQHNFLDSCPQVFFFIIIVVVMHERHFNLKCIFRFTSRTRWGRGSGLTAHTVRILSITSRPLSAQRCLLRVCCCRPTPAAPEGISVQVQYTENTQRGP